eukprot:TRINITY_DN490_c0_g2_i1.p1 TRINITY_DN490_c0_g2~~TRINITY_DN490_c0_g2_i1.p1  ORF type:complete len:2706 (+),score=713.81 TRINITY_DN490_c0_g2_i1:109-8118(+)
MTDCDLSILTTGTSGTHDPNGYRTRYLTKELIEKCGGSDDLSHLEYLQIKLPQGEKIKRIENLDLVPRLEKLVLQHQKIQRIEGIDKLYFLRFLSLKGNCIEFWDPQSTGSGIVNPREFKELPLLQHLQHLDLSKNHITTLPPSLSRSFPSIKSLILSDNRIEDISKTAPIRGCKNLEVLSLDGNPISVDFSHYRSFMVYSVPSVSLLDDVAVEDEERQEADIRWHSEQLNAKDNQIRELKTELASAVKESNELRQCVDSKQSVIDVNATILKKKEDAATVSDTKLNDLQKLADKRGDQISELLTDLILVKSTLGELLLELDSCDMDFKVTDTIKEVLCSASRISSTPDALPSGNVTEKVQNLENTIARRHQLLFSSPDERHKAAATELEVAALEAKLQKSKETQESLIKKIDSLSHLEEELETVKRENDNLASNMTDGTLVTSLQQQLTDATAQIDVLNARLSDHDSDHSLIATLQKQLSDAKDQQNEVYQLQEQVTDLNDKLSKQNDNSADLQQLNDLRRENQTLQQQLSDANKVISDLNKKLLKQPGDGVAKELEDATENCSILEKEISHLNEQLILLEDSATADLSTAMSDYNAKISEIEAQLSQSNENAENLELELSELQTELTVVKGRNITLEERVATLLTKVDEQGQLEEASEACNSKLVAMQAAISQLSSEKEELREHYNNAMQRVGEYEQQVIDLEDEKRQLASQIDSFKISTDNRLMDKIKHLESEIERKEQSASDRIRSLQEEVSHLTKDKSEHIVSVQALEEMRLENLNLRDQLKSHSKCTNCKVNQQRANSLEEDNEKLISASRDNRNEISRLKNENEVLKAELATKGHCDNCEHLIKEVADLKAKCEQLSHTIEALKKENSDLLQKDVTCPTCEALRRQQPEAPTDEASDLKAELSHLKDENAELREEVAQLTREKATQKTPVKSGIPDRRIHNLEAENQNLIEQIDLLQSELDACQSNTDLATQLLSLRTKHSNLLSRVGEMEVLLEEAEIVKQKYASLQGRLSALEDRCRDVDNLVEENANLQQKSATAQSKLCEQTATLDGVVSQLNTLRQKHTTVVSTVSELEIQLQSAQDDSSASARIAFLSEQKNSLESECSDLRSQITTLRQKNTHLANQVADLQIQPKRDDNTSRISSLSEQNESLESENSELSSQMTILKQKNATLTNTIGELEHQLEEQRASTKHDVTARMAFLSEQKESVEAENSDLSSQLVMLRQKNTALSNTVSELELQLEEQVSTRLLSKREDPRLAILSEQKEVLEAEVSNLTSQITTLRKKNVSLTTAMAELEAQPKRDHTAAGRISFLMEQKESLESENGDLSSQVSILRQKNATLITTISELEQQPKRDETTAARITSLSEQKESLESENSDLLSQISILRQKNATLTTTISELEQHPKRDEATAARITFLTEQKESLESENSDLLTQITTLRQKNSSLTTTITDMELQLSGMTTKNSSIQSRLTILLEQKGTLEEELHQATSQQASLSDKLAHSTEQLQSLKEEHQHMTQEHSSMVIDLQESEGREGRLSLQVSELRQKHAAAMTKIQSLEEKNSTLLQSKEDSADDIQIEVLKEQLRNEIAARVKISNDFENMQHLENPSQGVEIDFLKEQLHKEISNRVKLTSQLQEMQSTKSPAHTTVEIDVLKEQLSQEISTRIKYAGQVSELQHQISLLELKLSSSSPRDDPTRQLDWSDDQGAEVTILERELQSLQEQYSSLLTSYETLKAQTGSSAAVVGGRLHRQFGDDNDTPLSLSACTDSIPNSTPRFPGSEVEILSLRKKLSRAEGELTYKNDTAEQLRELSSKLAASEVEIGRLQDLIDSENLVQNQQNDWKEKHNTLLAEYETLSDKNMTLQITVEELRQRADQQDEHESDIRFLRHQLAEAVAENEALTQTKNTGDSSAEDLRAQISEVKAAAAAETTTLTTTISSLQRDNKKLLSEVEQKVRELAEKECQNQASMSVIEQLRTALQLSETNNERSERIGLATESDFTAAVNRADIAESSLKAAQARITSLEISLQESQARTLAVDEIMQTVVSAGGSQSVQLNKLIAHLSEASNKDVVLQEELSTIKNQLKSITGGQNDSTKIATLEAEVVRLQRNESLLEEQNASATAEILRLVAIVDSNKKDIDELISNTKELTAQLNSSTARSKHLQDKIESPVNDNKLLELEINRLQANEDQLEVVQAELQKSQTSNQLLREELSLSRRECSSIESELKAITLTKDATDSNNESLKSDLKDSLALLNSLRTENQTLNSNIADLNEKLRTSLKECEDLRNENRLLMQKISNLEGQLTALRNAQSSDLPSTRSASAKEADAECEILRNENRSLLQNISNLEEQLTSLRTTHHSETASTKEVVNECEFLRNENRSLLQKISIFEGQLTTIRSTQSSDLKEAIAECDFLRTENRTLVQRIANLDEQLSTLRTSQHTETSSGHTFRHTDRPSPQVRELTKAASPKDVIELQATLPQRGRHSRASSDIDIDGDNSAYHSIDDRRGSDTCQKLDLLQQEVSRLSEHIRGSGGGSGGGTSIRQWAQQNRTPLQEMLPVEMNSDRSSSNTAKRQQIFPQRHSSPPPRAASSVASQGAGSPGYHPQLFELHRQDAAVGKPALTNRPIDQEEHILVPRTYLESVYENTDLSRKMWRRKERNISGRGLR